MYIEYHVTGKTRDNKRFKKVYSGGFAYLTVMNINLWQGSVWGVLPTGKRKLLKSVYN